jgi:hypothetical protein
MSTARRVMMVLTVLRVTFTVLFRAVAATVASEPSPQRRRAGLA